jgi:hypothetical protein
MSNGKTEVPGIFKVREGVLINTDNNSLNAYKNKKKRDRQIQEDIQVLKNDLQEIKDLLRGLAK